MADETFRQKKPIDPSEVGEGDSPQEVQQQVRQAAAAEVGSDLTEPGGEGGMNVEGVVPQQFKAALARKRTDDSNPSPKKTKTNESSLRTTGSNKLEELLQGIQSTTHNYHEVTLPSLGRFYDGEDGPSDGVLHVRPMTGEEEQILATPRLVRKGQAINMIFDRCIQENFSSDKFLTPDRTYLLIFLRGLSYTKDYDVEVRCPECSTKFATLIDLDALWVDQCPLDFNESDLNDTLPTSEFEFTYRLSKGTDEQQIQDYRERRLKGFDTAGQSDDTLLYRTALLVDNIEGLTDKTELQLLLRRLPINDVAYLRNVVNDQPFGVDTDIDIACPSCFTEFSVDLPLEANFFFPRLKKDKRGTTQA